MNTSQHIGLVGCKVMMAASLDFKPLGSSSITLPVLLSILVCNSENLQAM